LIKTRSATKKNAINNSTASCISMQVHVLATAKTNCDTEKEKIDERWEMCVLFTNNLLSVGSNALCVFTCDTNQTTSQTPLQCQ